MMKEERMKIKSKQMIELFEIESCHLVQLIISVL